MNSVELAEHRMLVAMFIDSHRPDRRYMTRQDFADYHVDLEHALFRSIVTDLKSQGVVKAVPNGATYSVRLHADAHKEALSRILANLDADTFEVDWSTKRITHDGQAGDHDKLIPCPNSWMMLEFESERKPPVPAAAALPAVPPILPRPTPRSTQLAAKTSKPIRERLEMEGIGRYVSVWQSRIALGLAFFGALIVALWPDHARAVDPPKLMACILTGVAWLVAELASAVPRVSDHDKELFGRITGIMGDGALHFLMYQDFGNNVNAAQTMPITEIAEWHGPEYQFSDTAIQKRWLKLWNMFSDLSHLFGTHLVNTEGNVNLLTAWHFGVDRHNQPAQAHKEVKELNEGAHSLYVEYDKFVKYARRRMLL